ncbi:MAG TPA: hypothetical protein VJA94_03890 [Candidatus Angelobacter sp.]
MGVFSSAVRFVSHHAPSSTHKSTRQRQREFCRQLLAIGALLVAGTTWARAGTFIAFGPQDYMRGTGAPVTIVTNFSVRNPNTQYTLKAFNGGLQDNQTELVSGSVVALNGVQVIGANNFNQQVSEVDIPVTLQGSNTIAVEVRGQPGGLLTIEIVGIDNDPPTIQATVFPAPNAAGWNNSNVTVTFVCNDATSGVASCPSPTTVTTEGANQPVSGTATDAAGNSASTSVALNIDKTPPVISITSPANGATLTSASTTVTGVVSDILSGLAVVTCDGVPASVQNGSFSCPVTLTPGSNTITAQATDVAGNNSSATERVRFLIATIAYASARALNGTNAANTINNFDPPKFNVWSTNPDGSGQTPLTQLLGANSFSPVWSPDGRKIAFLSDHGSLISNIWVMNADGSGAIPLTQITANSVNVGIPQWSPDGSKIAYSSTRALDGSNAANTGLTGNVWIVNPDGTGSTPLTQYVDGTGTGNLAVSWSPDGNKIAFVSSAQVPDLGSTNGSVNIWVMNADGSGATPLTSLTAAFANSLAPAWSPDGTKIAYESTRALDGTNAASSPTAYNIWVMNADGSDSTPLTRMSFCCSDSHLPVWSPNSSKIAFLSSRALDGSNSPNFPNFTPNLWVMNTDGSGATPLTMMTQLASGTVPDPVVWSPDGSTITFDSRRALDGSNAANANFVSNIWVINADGTGATPLTTLTFPGANSIEPNEP